MKTSLITGGALYVALAFAQPGLAQERAKHVPAQAKQATHAPLANSVAPQRVLPHASNPHGIIFVGGHAALNPQPIPPGHSSSRPRR